MTSAPEITVTTEIRHPRLRYVLRVVGEDLGYRFRFANDRSVFGQRTPRYEIRYGGYGSRALPHHPLLSGKDTGPAPPAQLNDRGLPVFFLTDAGPDLLACIFFCLSRYEEYAPFTPDRHGRFPAERSHALRNDYLHRPVVREWTAAIGHQLRAWFPDLPPSRRHPFVFRPTYDIDLLWAYRHRGWRGHLSGLRDLLTGKPTRFLQRLRSSTDRDPYFTLPALESLHRRHGLRAIYFWLLADDRDTRDPNPYPIPPEQEKWMRSLATGADLGIHPGYRSVEQPALIGRELERLEGIVGRAITDSRQHFLRFRLPDTYCQLLKHGIRSDHSMGYADHSGWRAGTNLPYLWYDLERERETRLRIHPFAAMDVTLKNYERLAGADAGAAVLRLASLLGSYGGPFPLLWHNSSFAEEFGWKGWWDVYSGLVERLVAMGQANPGS
ncbi:polysaccharide deacetylase family protein [Lewinella sp. JB7]|nr:polysaccharide deacetylase family protein [Lewinella sp. JB7]